MSKEEKVEEIELLQLLRRQMDRCLWNYYSFYQNLKVLDVMIPTEFKNTLKNGIIKDTLLKVKCSNCGEKNSFSATINFSDNTLELTCLKCKTKASVTFFLDSSLYTLEENVEKENEK